MNTLISGLNTVADNLDKNLGKLNKSEMTDIIYSTQGENVTEEVLVLAHDILMRHFNGVGSSSYEFTYGLSSALRTEVARLRKMELVSV